VSILLTEENICFMFSKGFINDFRYFINAKHVEKE
jgi:hypothetical protein